MSTYTERATKDIKNTIGTLMQKKMLITASHLAFCLDLLKKAKVIRLPIGGRMLNDRQHLMKNDPAILKLPHSCITLEYKIKEKGSYWLKEVETREMPYRLVLAFDSTYLQSDFPGICVLCFASKNSHHWISWPLIAYLPLERSSKKNKSWSEGVNIPESKHYIQTEIEIQYGIFLDEIFKVIEKSYGKERALKLCEADMIDEISALLDFLYDTNKN